MHGLAAGADRPERAYSQPSRVTTDSKVVIEIEVSTAESQKPELF